ncbi:MAG: bifunctional riboflavin kinase/FAD synthetase [Cellulosilyticaceae bacterium]
MMQYLCGDAEVALESSSIIALGNFDGVHRGHQKLLEMTLQIAQEKKMLAVALSFFPHPTMVLGTSPKPLVMSRKDRKNKMKAMGMDVFIEYPFTKDFASISPKIFFETILWEQLKADTIVVGSNYYFGKDKEGDIQFLKEMGALHNVTICVVDTVQDKGKVISSTEIRKAIRKGDMEQATEWLGHPYSVVGSVIHGKKLGRTIGFPTINLIADPDRVHPPNGVYATIVKVYNQLFMGITNIGYNPTVGGKVKMIETHLFDFEGDLYGEEVEVMFYEAIRPEKKFASIDELSAQITKDKEKARFFLRDKLK